MVATCTGSCILPELFRQAVPLVGTRIEREHERTYPAILPERDGPSGGQQGGTILRHGAIGQAAGKNSCLQDAS